MDQRNNILELHNVTKRFSGLMANEDISFDVKRGEIIGIVGPNGAGKTTLFNMISGALPVTSGKIVFNGEEITKCKAYQISQKGVGRTFQIPQALNDLTVSENALVGALSRYRTVDQAQSYADEMLALCGLLPYKDMHAYSLNVTQKKRLEICRALASKPSLLLLDETMAGLSSEGRAEAIELIRTIHTSGITIIMIEHIMQVVMSISERVVVLNSGKVLNCGTPAEVTSNDEVISAYLGGD